MFRKVRCWARHFKCGSYVTKQPKVLYNVVLPLIFTEVWSVLLAFIGVVLIEALIIKAMLKDNFENVIKKIIYVNFITTILGYLLQGIARCMALPLIASLNNFPKSLLYKNEVVAGLFGNVGSAFMPMRLFEKVPVATSVEIGMSFLITFTISVIFETRSLKKAYAGNEEIQRHIPNTVLIANIVSYILLLIWVLYYIKTH